MQAKTKQGVLSLMIMMFMGPIRNSITQEVLKETAQNSFASRLSVYLTKPFTTLLQSKQLTEKRSHLHKQQQLPLFTLRHTCPGLALWRFWGLSHKL